MSRIIPYEGNEPYIFISYSHKDDERVMKIVGRLCNDGYRVWYDEGIEAGTDWIKNITEHILNSECMISFVTDNYISSENCLDEIEHAKNRKISSIVMYLDDIEIPDWFEMRYSRTQAVVAWKYDNEDEMFKRLYTAKSLKPCKVSVDSEFDELCRKAAEGDAGAQNNLGEYYKKSNSYSTATRLFSKEATEQGRAIAHYIIGFCCSKGNGIEQDYAEAVKWYKKAAKQGHAEAQCNLGYYYATGKGVQQDYEEAVKWYTKAAKQGNANAQFNLGLCYENGIGVEQDIEEAINWYKKAVEQGHTGALAKLASYGY